MNIGRLLLLLIALFLWMILGAVLKSTDDDETEDGSKTDDAKTENSGDLNQHFDVEIPN